MHTGLTTRGAAPRRVAGVVSAATRLRGTCSHPVSLLSAVLTGQTRHSVRYHGRVPDHDLRALESYQLLPRLLHAVENPDTSVQLLGRTLTAPILPLFEAPIPTTPDTLALLSADAVLAQPDGPVGTSFIPLLKPEKMGHLMPKVRALAARGVPGFVRNNFV